MVNLSNDQKNAITSLRNANVIVDSVAGSGKTTTILEIARMYPKDHILVLTYSARLKDDTRARVLAAGLTNMETFGFHSFCHNHYQPCRNDLSMTQILDDNMPYLGDSKFSIIVIDEAQDITPILHRLIHKIYADVSIKRTASTMGTRLYVVGDAKQSIYAFKHSDARFLTMADRCFNLNNYTWARHTLNTSYRITTEMAGFVNNVMKCSESKDKPRIVSSKQSTNSVQYLEYNGFNRDDRVSDVVRHVKEAVKAYGAGNIFILSPSLKTSTGIRDSPITILENRLKTCGMGINIFISRGHGTINERMIRGKLVMTTFHQSKGLERDVVFVLGFDYKYFVYFNDENPKRCPNILYVAATRAKKKLIVCAGTTTPIAPFVSRSALSAIPTLGTTNYNPTTKTLLKQTKYHKANVPYKQSVTDVLNFSNEIAISKCIGKIITTIDHTEHKLLIDFDMPLDENVADIIGTMIPIWWGYKRGQLFPCNGISDDVSKTRLNSNGYKCGRAKCRKSDAGCIKGCPNIAKIKIAYLNEQLTNGKITIAEFTYLTTRYMSWSGGFIHKSLQNKKFDWVSQTAMSQCMTNLDKLNISESAELEYPVSGDVTKHNDVGEIATYPILGFIDCVDFKNKVVYEFKCVAELTYTHKLQLLIYAYLFELQPEHSGFTYILFNIRTGEKLELKPTVKSNYLLVKEWSTILKSLHVCDTTEEGAEAKYNRECMALYPKMGSFRKVVDIVIDDKYSKILSLDNFIRDFCTTKPKKSKKSKKLESKDS